MSKILFCPICNQWVNTKEEEKDAQLPVKEELILVHGKYICCYKCGAVLWDSNNQFEKIAFSIYKKKHSLLSAEEIKNMRVAAHLSVEEFGKKLGITSRKIESYERGSIQSEEHNKLFLMFKNGEIK